MVRVRLLQVYIQVSIGAVVLWGGFDWDRWVEGSLSWGRLRFIWDRTGMGRS